MSYAMLQLATFQNSSMDFIRTFSRCSTLNLITEPNKNLHTEAKGMHFQKQFLATLNFSIARRKVNV